MTLFKEIDLDPMQVSLDAMAKVRVSQETTLFDGKVLNSDRTLLWENAGTGTGTYSASKYNMNVTSGQWYVRQSKRFYPYFSGKSQVIELTFDNFDTEANVVKRVGYFSSNAVSPFDSTYDGFWLEDDGTTKRIIAKRAGTETLNVAIANWTSAGSYNWAAHDWSKFNVVKFDFLWLGGAILRMFVDTPDGLLLAHVHVHAVSNADVFIQSPNQPVRYEIRSSTGTGDFRYICSAVATEGSIDESGLVRSVNTGHVGIAMATVGTKYPLKAIRKATTSRDIAVKLEDIIVFLSSNTDQVLWSVELNPTLSAGLTYSAVPNSAVEEASGNGTITVSSAGTILASGYLYQNLITPPNVLEKDFLSFLGSTLTNTMDQLVLCIIPITSTVTLFGQMQYKEY